MSDKQWTYLFQVWPDETWKWHPAVFAVFRAIGSRVAMDFTESEFEGFRSGLSHHRLTLREVERVPYHEPESVS